MLGLLFYALGKIRKGISMTTLLLIRTTQLEKLPALDLRPLHPVPVMMPSLTKVKEFFNGSRQSYHKAYQDD